MELNQVVFHNYILVHEIYGRVYTNLAFVNDVTITNK